MDEMDAAPLMTPDGRQRFEQALLTGWGRGEHEQHIAFWKGIGDGLVAGAIGKERGRHDADVVQSGLPQGLRWALREAPTVG